MELVVQRAYRGAWRAAEPLVTWYIKRKDLQRGVLPALTAERFGRSEPPAEWQQRADDEYFTLWIHGASVGETLSALPIIALVLSDAFLLSASGDADSKKKKTRVLLSTTTPAARKLLSERLSTMASKSNALCIFAPLDHPEWVRRFFETWKPDAGLWIESELWPNMILEASKRQIRIGVVNGRISERSFQRWQLPVLRQFAHSLMQSFSMVLCQNEQNAQRFKALGASTTDVLTNLKFATKQQVGYDKAQVMQLQNAIAGRCSWVAVSTHEGEELQIAEAHVQLSNSFLSQNTRVVTIVIPRHPDRVSAIVEEIQHRFPELEVAFRSRDSVPRPTTSIFIVDTMVSSCCLLYSVLVPNSERCRDADSVCYNVQGETELFFNAVATVFVGGTIANCGGHNPIEPLRAGCQVFVGPNMQNFEDVVEQISAMQAQRTAAFPQASPTESQQAIKSVKDAFELAEALEMHFQSSQKPSRSLHNQEMMQTLAVRSLRGHERKLLEWLATDNNKSTN